MKTEEEQCLGGSCVRLSRPGKKRSVFARNNFGPMPAGKTSFKAPLRRHAYSK